MTFLRFCAYFMHFFLIRKNKELSNCFCQCSMFCVLCERGQIFLALFLALHLMRKGPHKFISSQDVCMSTRKKMGVNIFLSINIRKNLEENWMWFGRYWFSFVFVIILFVDFVLFRWKSLVPCYRWEFSFSNFPRVITYNSFDNVKDQYSSLSIFSRISVLLTTSKQNELLACLHLTNL